MSRVGGFFRIDVSITRHRLWFEGLQASSQRASVHRGSDASHVGNARHATSWRESRGPNCSLDSRVKLSVLNPRAVSVLLHAHRDRNPYLPSPKANSTTNFASAAGDPDFRFSGGRAHRTETRAYLKALIHRDRRGSWPSAFTQGSCVASRSRHDWRRTSVNGSPLLLACNPSNTTYACVSRTSIRRNPATRDTTGNCDVCWRRRQCIADSGSASLPRANPLPGVQAQSSVTPRAAALRSSLSRHRSQHAEPGRSRPSRPCGAT